VPSFVYYVNNISILILHLFLFYYRVKYLNLSSAKFDNNYVIILKIISAIEDENVK